MVEFKRPAHIPRYSDPVAPEDIERAPAPDIRNVDAALALLEYRALDICGRQYRVPPISGRDGVVLLDILERLSAMKDGPRSVAPYAALLRDVERVARRLLIPLGNKRYLWKLGMRRNPLRGASEQEVWHVLNFLSRCRTSGHVRISQISLGERSRETWLTN